MTRDFLVAQSHTHSPNFAANLLPPKNEVKETSGQMAGQAPVESEKARKIMEGFKL